LGPFSLLERRLTASGLDREARSKPTIATTLFRDKIQQLRSITRVRVRAPGLLSPGPGPALGG